VYLTQDSAQQITIKQALDFRTHGLLCPLIEEPVLHQHPAAGISAGRGTLQDLVDRDRSMAHGVCAVGTEAGQGADLGEACNAGCYRQPRRRGSSGSRAHSL